MKKRTIFIFALFLPLLVILISWYFNDFYPFGDQTIMAVDFGNQYIDLFAFYRQTLLNQDWSNLFYSFSKSIGGSTTGIWGYYLMSPLNLIYLLFDEPNLPIAAHIITLLRYMLSGLTMSIFLYHRVNKDDHKTQYLIPIFSTAYALSGYAVSYQMNPLFMDALIMLPLIIMGLEQLFEGKRPYLYIITLALMIVFQFYLAYMICIFIVLYTVYYSIIANQNIFRNFIRMAIYSLLAAGLIGIFIAPLFFNLVSSKGALSSGLDWKFQLQMNPLDIISKLYIGPFDNDSWPHGPNLPNIYVGNLALIGSILYFLSKKVSRKHKIAAFAMIVVFIISIAHKGINQIWHMGQTPAGFFYRFSFLISFFLIYLAYSYYSYQEEMSRKDILILALSLIFSMVIVIYKDFSFLTSWQIVLSAFLFILMIMLIYIEVNTKWLAIAFITLSELGLNSYLSQSRIGYPSFNSYQSAVTLNEGIISQVRPDSDEFYRINTLFYRTKNDPFMANFYGFTNFSSNLENNTRNLFYYLGSNGINAATTYNGNALLDGIFSVKYTIDDKRNLPDEDRVEGEYYYRDDFQRKDVVNNHEVVFEDRRFKIHGHEDYLPIAFGVSEELVNLELIQDEPTYNHQLIIDALDRRDQEMITFMAVHEFTSENMEISVNESGQKIAKKVEGAESGTLNFTYYPQSTQSYFVEIPKQLRFNDDNNIQFKLNGANLPLIKKFEHDQLVNLSANEVGAAQTFSVVAEDDAPINIDEIKFSRFNDELIKELIDLVRYQGIKLTSFEGNYIEGVMNLADDSQYVMTSIPYDESWQIKVNGEVVEGIEVWEGLLAFPAKDKRLTVALTYVPKGLIIGEAISVISLIALILLVFRYNRLKESKIGRWV